MQAHVHVLFRAGTLPMSVVGEPGTHGAGTTGVHAPGVSTPSAAAVCAAVIGLARLVHIPNDPMLRNGLLSMIVAAGLFSIITAFVGKTLNVPGLRPNGQVSI